MAINSDALHAILTTILGAFKSPTHALGSDGSPDSWTAYGNLPFRLCSLIGQIGDLPGGLEHLSPNDQGKLKATLANELQLQEERAEAVLHAQLRFMQTVAEAAVDAVTEVSDALQEAIDGQGGEDESQPGDDVSEDVGQEDKESDEEQTIVTPTNNILPDELGKPDPDRDPSPPTIGEPADFPGKNVPPAEEAEAPVPEEAPAADLPTEPIVESDPNQSAAGEAVPVEGEEQKADGQAEEDAKPEEQALPDAATEAPAEEGKKEEPAIDPTASI